MDESSAEIIFQQFLSDLYQERLGRHSSSKQPPWQLRKKRDIVRALANPDIRKDLSVLYVCSWKSILGYQQLLLKHFQSYGLSLEIAESLILFCGTWDIDFLVAGKQIDGVRFFNDDMKIAGPAGRPSIAYKNLVDDIKRHDPYMNIRIGRSATKEDVKWLIDRYWLTEIQPVSNPYSSQAPNTQGNPNLRDLTAYALRRDGWSYKEIQSYIYDYFGEKIVEESQLRRAYKDNKPKYSLFHEAWGQMPKISKAADISKMCKLVFIEDSKNPHFEIIKM